MEKLAEEKVENSMIMVDGKYQVSTPWKSDRPKLVDNRNEVLKRQGRVEMRLKKETKRFVQCDKKIEEQVEKGYLKELGCVQDVKDEGFYIPVLPVTDKNRETTKTRMVLDCAAKFNEVSLNDTINPGPKLITELFDVIRRFRRYPVAISGDVSEMFMQIMLDPEDRQYYRIIWDGHREP